MKKILEYKVFDLLQNKENEEFLDKVKKENPDLYIKFLNVLGNKGLDRAKEKYKEYDPEYIKSERSKKKKENNKKNKEKLRKNLLELYSEEIKEIEKILSESPLKKILKYIKSDEILKEYLEKCRAKKQYKNTFLEVIRGQFNKFRGNRWLSHTKIEYLLFTQSKYSEYDFEKITNNIITISHSYNLEKHESDYNLSINRSGTHTMYDIMKGEEFIKYRNKSMEDLVCYNITENELLNKIKKLSYYLSDDFYEEWKMEQDVKKYNL